MWSPVSPECQKDCNKVVDLMKEFSAPERQRVVHTAEDVARMRVSQTVLDKRKKPIHVPQPTSPVNVDLLSMRNMGEGRHRARREANCTLNFDVMCNSTSNGSST